MSKSVPPILLAAMALELGGAETHVISLACELRRRGCRVVVASAGGRLVPMLAEAGVHHVQVPMDNRSPVSMLRAYSRLGQLVSDFGVGLIHAHARIPAFISSMVAAGRRIPLVTTYHGVYNAGFPWRYLTRFGDRTIAVSEDVKRHLIGPLNAPPGNIRLIPNGFDTGRFHPGVDIAPLLREFGVQAAETHIVNAGRLDDDLVDVPVALIHALPELGRSLPGVRLWILGEGKRGDEVRRLTEEMNRRLGRRAAIATGMRLDVPQFFNLADVVVAVARTALEGMACGRPVIIAGQGGYRGVLSPERIEEYSRSNFTAREGGQPVEASRLAADLISLLRPEAGPERKRLGEAGRKFVVDNLSIEAITARIVDVYAEVL